MKQRIVAVKFKHAYDKEEWGNKNFHYYTSINGLEAGDLVVVETQYGYSVAQVVRYVSSSRHVFRYVIQKVDLEAHEKFLEKETKLEFIRAEIEDRAEAIRERKELEALAAEDKEMKNLIDEMDKLLS